MGQQGKHPPKDVTAHRRRRVEELWMEGHNVADILRTIESETGETWSRPTIYKDLDYMRKQWETEGSKRSREHVRGTLERMARKVFVAAMSRKATVTRRTKAADGKLTIDTVVIPDPDLAGANKALERIAALHGLNVSMVEGDIGLGGLADIFGALDAE